jgi:hypothetical protein
MANMTDPTDLWKAWRAAELAYREEADKYFSAEPGVEDEAVIGSGASIDQAGMARLADLRTMLSIAQTSYAATRLVAEANTPAD